jgi:hypothetical protein
MLKRVEAMELQKFGQVSVDTVEARVQALELAIFHKEEKGLLSLRMASLAEMLGCTDEATGL